MKLTLAQWNKLENLARRDFAQAMRDYEKESARVKKEGLTTSTDLEILAKKCQEARDLWHALCEQPLQ